ncbi:MAG: gluconate 2-dehydrogenase subunit 3 family protein [Chloroflexota bacterium]
MPPTPIQEFLSDPQRALLAAVLDQLIPAKRDVPGAGTLGVGRTVELSLATASETRRSLIDALASIEITSDGRFVQMDVAERDATLRVVEAAHPRLFSELVQHTYRGYYTHPRVIASVQPSTAPPQPLGHTLPPFDESLLSRQRARDPFWRRTDTN